MLLCFLQIFLCSWFAWFLSSPIHNLFRCVCLKKTYNFIFKFTYTFSYRQKNTINQAYQVFLMGIIFFIPFSFNLSISSTDIIMSLKNSSTISLLIFTSPSFNCLCLERLFFTFKNWFFQILSNLYQYFRFYNLDFPSLYINKKNSKFLKNKKYYIIYSAHITYIAHNLPNLHT